MNVNPPTTSAELNSAQAQTQEVARFESVKKILEANPGELVFTLMSRAGEFQVFGGNSSTTDVINALKLGAKREGTNYTRPPASPGLLKILEEAARDLGREWTFSRDEALPSRATINITAAPVETLPAPRNVVLFGKKTEVSRLDVSTRNPGQALPKPAAG